MQKLNSLACKVSESDELIKKLSALPEALAKQAETIDSLSTLVYDYPMDFDSMWDENFEEIPSADVNPQSLSEPIDPRQAFSDLITSKGIVIRCHSLKLRSV